MSVSFSAPISPKQAPSETQRVPQRSFRKDPTGFKLFLFPMLVPYLSVDDMKALSIYAAEEDARREQREGVVVPSTGSFYLEAIRRGCERDTPYFVECEKHGRMSYFNDCFFQRKGKESLYRNDTFKKYVRGCLPAYGKRLEEILKRKFSIVSAAQNFSIRHSQTLRIRSKDVLLFRQLVQGPEKLALQSLHLDIENRFCFSETLGVLTWKCPFLKKLFLSSMSIEGGQNSHTLPPLHLQKLVLSHCKIRDLQGMEWLFSEVVSLKLLNVEFVKGKTTEDELLKKCKKLNALEFYNQDPFDIKNLPSLKKLKFFLSFMLSVGPSLEVLMNCPSTLEEITTNVDLSKEAVDHFPPFLRVLDIWGTAEFTRDAWGSLSRFAELKALRINATSITEGETQVLSSLYNLKYLNLFGDHAPEVDDPLPNISESAVCVLAKSLSPHLEEFRCSKKWTNASIFHLVFLCKECEGLKKLAIFWPPSLATTFEQLTKILQLIKPGLIVENLLSDLKRPYESRIPEEYT